MRWSRGIDELREDEVTAEKHGSQLCHPHKYLIPVGGQRKSEKEVFKPLLS